jgi:hypothetical protein
MKMSKYDKYPWFKRDDAEKYRGRGRPKWHNRFRSIIYGIFAFICLLLAVYGLEVDGIQEGIFFVFSCVFLGATIASIMVRNMRVKSSEE